MAPPSGSFARALNEARDDLGDPALRSTLIQLVRRKVPERDVEDIVQDTLADALATKEPPAEKTKLRHWARGIARHKVVDFHRRASREDIVASPQPEIDDSSAAAPEPDSAFDLRRWAEKRLPEGASSRRVFQWMLEEGEGEKLEHIATREKLPATTVRQQVARMRRHLRERWALEAALLVTAGLLAAAFLLGWGARRDLVVRDSSREAPRAVVPTPAVHAEHERQVAGDRATADDWRGCLDALDRAAALDPEGDSTEPARRLRQMAEDALSRHTPAPSPSATTGAVRRRPGYDRLPSDTAPLAPHPCVCSRGDPLCSCLAP